MQLLFADFIPGYPRPVGRPHYTWMDGAMQNLSALAPRAPATAGPPTGLAEAGAGPGFVEGVCCQPVPVWVLAFTGLRFNLKGASLGACIHRPTL